MFGDSRTDFAWMFGDWESLLHEPGIVNAGVGGWQSLTLKNALEACADPKKPTLKLKGKASFMIGGNDYLQNISPYLDILGGQARLEATTSNLKNNIYAIRDILRQKCSSRYISKELQTPSPSR